MAELSRISSRIQELGFTSYEAKAYVSLLQNNPVTRYELSKNSGVPRSAIYGVIKKLESIGAVNALYSKPEKYVPLQPEQLLQMLQERFKHKIKNARKSLRGIESNLQADHLLPSIHSSVDPVSVPINRKKGMTGILVGMKFIYLFKAFELLLYPGDILRRR